MLRVAVVERPDLRPVLLKLAPQQVMVSRLAGEPVPILGQYYGHAASRYQIPNVVHPRPFEARPALPRIGDLLQHVVALARGVPRSASSCWARL